MTTIPGWRRKLFSFLTVLLLLAGRRVSLSPAHLPARSRLAGRFMHSEADMGNDGHRYARTNSPLDWLREVCRSIRVYTLTGLTTCDKCPGYIRLELQSSILASWAGTRKAKAPASRQGAYIGMSAKTHLFRPSLGYKGNA